MIKQGVDHLDGRILFPLLFVGIALTNGES